MALFTQPLLVFIDIYFRIVISYRIIEKIKTNYEEVVNVRKYDDVRGGYVITKPPNTANTCH